MANVLKCKTRNRDGLGFDLDPSQSDIWVRVLVAMDSTALDFFGALGPGDAFSEAIIGLVRGGGAQPPDQGDQNEGIYLANFGEGLEWWEVVGGESSSDDVPTATGWVPLDLHFQQSLLVEVFANGSEVITNSGASVDDQLCVAVVVGQAASPGVVSIEAPNDVFVYIGYVLIGTSQGAHDIFCDSFQAGISPEWSSTFGAPSIVSDPFGGDTDFACSVPEVPDSFNNRDRIPWRFVIASLRNGDGDPETRTLTFLDRLASERSVLYTLNQPAQTAGVVPSDNTEINILHTDGEPFLSYNDRAIFGFRRENIGDSELDPWVCRYAGLVMQLQDEGDANRGVTHYTAYDPWKYLYARPLRLRDELFNILPKQSGMTFDNVRGNVIAVELLRRTHEVDGNTYIDYGQTGFFTGTIEDTDHLQLNFAQGTSVGEAWTTLVETGSIDIVLTPIWDPENRPGILCELNIYVSAGQPRWDAVMSWDTAGRSLVGVDRMVDGTEMANKLVFFGGQGGRPIGRATDDDEIAHYGQWWAQEAYPGHSIIPAIVQALADAQLALRKAGKISLTASPAPDRAPRLFAEYFLGDVVPLWASRRLRKATNLDPDALAPARVYSIPVQIGDDSTERINAMLLTDSSG